MKSRLFLFGVFAALALPSLVLAQAAAKKEGEEEIPKPVPFEITTLDGLALKGTFYPGMMGKETVPVVLLHAHKGTRADWLTVPLTLQAQGHAVLALDMRGHGESTTFTNGKPSVSALNMPPVNYSLMVESDMEAVKTWLLAQHNEGKLNVDRLVLVGAEMGAVVAVNYAARDWSWPVLATGKQGQDVKGLVLISPTWNFKGMGITQALNAPSLRSLISLQLVVGGKDANATGETTRIQAMCKGHRKTEFKDAQEQAKLQDMFLDKYDTSLQGTKMLTVKNLKLANSTIEERMAKFIKLRAVDPPFPWKDRTNPLAK